MLPLNPKGELKEGWYNPKENNDDRSKVFDQLSYDKKILLAILKMFQLGQSLSKPIKAESRYVES